MEELSIRRSGASNGYPKFARSAAWQFPVPSADRPGPVPAYLAQDSNALIFPVITDDLILVIKKRDFGLQCARTHQGEI
jgi:hypothetical protein